MLENISDNKPSGQHMENNNRLNIGSVVSEKSHILILNRSKILFPIGKGAAWSLVKPTSVKYYDIPEETHELIKYQKAYKDIAIYYAGTHKSMWETLGIPYAISWHGGDVPFIMAGSNLVKEETGWRESLLKYLLDRSGYISVETENNPKAAVPIVISDISKILSSNNNILIFPETTRSRSGLIADFKPAGFQGLAQAVFNGTKAYIIPVNVDYHKFTELEEFAGDNELRRLKPLMFSEEFSNLTKSKKLVAMREIYYFTHFATEKKYLELEDMIHSGNPDFKSQWKKFEEKYTFSIKDIKKWKAFIGDVYISFGKPIIVEKNENRDYRRELADKSREACLNLVKIQKEQVISESIVRINPKFGAPIHNHELFSSIAGVMNDLEPYEDQFINFNMTSRPADIVLSSGIGINSELLEKYKIYANQIRHYVSSK